MEPLIACYKRCRELGEADYETDAQADFIANECEEVCNHILRVLYDIGGYTYGETILWDADRLLPPSARELTSEV